MPLFKKRSVAGLIICLSMVVSFQNCGQNIQSINNESNGSQGKTNTSSTAGQKLLLATVDIIEIPPSPDLDLSIAGAVGDSSNNSDILFIEKKIFIEPITGHIQVVDHDDNVIPSLEFCMSPDDLSELQAIISSGSICEGKEDKSPDRVCSMDYRFPYSRLHFPSEIVSVGESFSGCHQGPDLCGEYGNLLKSFITHIVKDLKQMKCHFQSL